MAKLPEQPSLSAQFCFSSGTLSDFLRLSRSSIDDSITQNLNALVTPSRAGFDPKSTSQRATTTYTRHINAEACDSFRDNVLLPAWQARTEVLNYCGLVATSPDPTDPEATIREVENQKDREKIVDERLDPYSGRLFPREARTQKLATLVQQERGIENVVRNRTWSVVQERCPNQYGTWQDAIANFTASREVDKSP